MPYLDDGHTHGLLRSAAPSPHKYREATAIHLAARPLKADSFVANSDQTSWLASTVVFKIGNSPHSPLRFVLTNETSIVASTPRHLLGNGNSNTNNSFLERGLRRCSFYLEKSIIKLFLSTSFSLSRGMLQEGVFDVRSEPLNFIPFQRLRYVHIWVSVSHEEFFGGSKLCSAKADAICFQLWQQN